MSKLHILGLATLLTIALPGAYAAAAPSRDVHGQVISITLTKDCPAQWACAADVGLSTDTGYTGKVVKFHVRPDTEIVRGGHLITLSELSVGDTVAIPTYDRITAQTRTAKPVLFD